LSGSSQDFAKGACDITYSYLVELPDEGEHKFLLPESQIEDTGTEVWEAVKVVANHVRRKYSKVDEEDQSLEEEEGPSSEYNEDISSASSESDEENDLNK